MSEAEDRLYGLMEIADRQQAAVRSAVQESFSGVRVQGVEAVQAASRPLLSKLAGMTEAAGQAERAMRGVVLWASWRLLGWLLAVVAGLMLLVWVANTGMLWWDASAIGAAQARKLELQAEVAEMQANRDDWAKAGMLAKLEKCGPKARPCVRVDESAGAFGNQSDYRVILGY